MLGADDFSRNADESIGVAALATRLKRLTATSHFSPPSPFPRFGERGVRIVGGLVGAFNELGFLAPRSARRLLAAYPVQSTCPLR